MADPVQDILTPERIAILRNTLSSGRFATYFKLAGHDEERAIRLYMWNAQVGEAFHIPIQAIEVGLRNRIDNALGQLFTPNWWECAGLFRILDEERQADLTTVFRRIRNRDLEFCTGQVIAGLSLGFWVGLLDGRYNPPIWSKQLRAAFPHLPQGRGRKSLFAEAGKVATLRNRISHHEPLIKRDISQDYATVMGFLEWICPATAQWVRPHCRIPLVLRQKP
jgi:hypothetical protein